MDSFVEYLNSSIPALVPALRALLLVVLISPLAAALVFGLIGKRGSNPRRLVLWFVVLHLSLTSGLVVLVAVQLTQRGDPTGTGFSLFRADPGFRPVAVPGDPGYENDENSQTHETKWGILPLGRRSARDIP